MRKNRILPYLSGDCIIICVVAENFGYLVKGYQGNVLVATVSPREIFVGKRSVDALESLRVVVDTGIIQEALTILPEEFDAYIWKDYDLGINNTYPFSEDSARIANIRSLEENSSDGKRCIYVDTGTGYNIETFHAVSAEFILRFSYKMDPETVKDVLVKIMSPEIFPDSISLMDMNLSDAPTVEDYIIGFHCGPVTEEEDEEDNTEVIAS